MVGIDKIHPWARGGKGLLPEATWRTLPELGATRLKRRHDPDEIDLCHEEHWPAEGRWRHATGYSFKRGTSRRFLVTAAHFSPAAWGGRTTMANSLSRTLSWAFASSRPPGRSTLL